MGLFSELARSVGGHIQSQQPGPRPIIDLGSASDEIRRRRRAKMSGRRKTIVTGDLTPEDPGRTNLLGRPA